MLPENGRLRKRKKSLHLLLPKPLFLPAPEYLYFHTKMPLAVRILQTKPSGLNPSVQNTFVPSRKKHTSQFPPVDLFPPFHCRQWYPHPDRNTDCPPALPASLNESVHPPSPHLKCRFRPFCIRFQCSSHCLRYTSHTWGFPAPFRLHSRHPPAGQNHRSDHFLQSPAPWHNHLLKQEFPVFVMY